MKKPAGVLIAVIVGIVVLCCGGSAIVLPKLVGMATTEISGAEKEGSAAVMALTANWDKAELLKHASPALAATLQDPASQSILDTWKNTYGAFRSGSSQVTGFNAAAESTTGKKFIATYTNNSTFEKSSAVLTLSLVKDQGSDWKVDAVQIGGVSLGKFPN